MIKTFFFNFLKGIALGVANVLPGISGGTVAVILHIYDKLTDAIGNFFIVPMSKKLTFLKFLFQIGLGMGVGIILSILFISGMYEMYPKLTTGFFLLLIIPSTPLILKGENLLKKENIFALFGGVFFVGIFIVLSWYFKKDETLSGDISSTLTTLYAGKLFFCGLIAAGAMIIPGISGSLILILLGEYYNIIGLIKSFAIIPVGIFACGTVLGLVLVAKGMNMLLQKYKSKVLFFITGIIVVSVIEIIRMTYFS
ncbi:MAG: DUF368 domain-containing protein [Treponemataceae bacterium]